MDRFFFIVYAIQEVTLGSLEALKVYKPITLAGSGNPIWHQRASTSAFTKIGIENVTKWSKVLSLIEHLLEYLILNVL